MKDYKLTIGLDVLVNTRTGDALRGKIREITRTTIHLGDVTLYTEGRKDGIDGEAVVPADNIAWVQVI